MTEQPPDHCYVIIQNHGATDGGWGPAAYMLPSIGMGTGPLVYTGTDPHTIEKLRGAAAETARLTGKPTRLVCFTLREDVASFGGES